MRFCLQDVRELLIQEFVQATQMEADTIHKIIFQLLEDRPFSLAQAVAWLSESAKASQAGQSNLLERLTPIVLGLKRTGYLISSTQLLRKAAAEAVKSHIRQGCPGAACIGMHKAVCLWSGSFKACLLGAAILLDLKRMSDSCLQLLCAGSKWRSCCII